MRRPQIVSKLTHPMYAQSILARPYRLCGLLIHSQYDTIFIHVVRLIHLR